MEVSDFIACLFNNAKQYRESFLKLRQQRSIVKVM